MKLPNPTTIAADRGLYTTLPTALAQRAVQAMDPYVPKKTGALAGSVTVSGAGEGKCLIRYNVPYARKVYHTHPAKSRWLEQARQDGAFSRR